MALPKGVKIVNAPKPIAPAGTTNYDDKVRAANAEATAKANQGPKGFDVDWKRLGMMVGGGLLAHTLASSLMNNKSDEEKRRESIWERLLAAVIPIGAMGVGAWGGKYLHSKMAAADEGTGFVFDDNPAKTNSFYQISSNLPRARALFESVANRAGDGEMPLSHRMREAAKDMRSEADRNAQNASDWSLGLGLGAGASAAGAAYSGLKWRDYVNQDRRFGAAQSIIDQAETAQAEKAQYQARLAEHQRALDELEQAKARQISRAGKAEGVQMGKRPSGEAARILMEAEAERGAIQKQIEALQKTAPTPPTAKGPSATAVNEAYAARKPFIENGRAMPGATSLRQLPRRVAKAGTIGGAALTASQIAAALFNNHVANKQQQRATELQNLINILPPAVAKPSN